jgi:hypothetical protein
VTFLGLLDFQASHWLKFCSSQPLASSIKQAFGVPQFILQNHIYEINISRKIGRKGTFTT